MHNAPRHFNMLELNLWQLKFAIDYRKVIDRLTSNKNLGLQQYELSDDEWEIAKQLSSLLMVRTMGVTAVWPLTNHCPDIQRCDFVLFMLDTQHPHCPSSHGPHQWVADDSLCQLKASHIHLHGCQPVQENLKPVLRAFGLLQGLSHHNGYIFWFYVFNDSLIN